MADSLIFRAFLSYAHQDIVADPALLKHFKEDLENQVNVRLLGARFVIWRDEEGMHTGDRWDTRIETELRNSHILIVLLSPRWIDSDYCRKEYLIFEEVEASRQVGDYVAPIFVREIARQEKHLGGDKKDVYERIRARQYAKVHTTERTSTINKVADDIEGMIERLRLPISFQMPIAALPPIRPVRSRRKIKSDASAQKYDRVDFLVEAAVVLNRLKERGDVLVHVSFVERLYVQGVHGRIEFGVRRAFVSVATDGPALSKTDELRGGGDHTNFRYVQLRDAPDAVTICIDPPPGKSSLVEFPLPPYQNENFLSKIATAPAEVRAAHLNATLAVSLDVEGLYLANEAKQMSAKTEEAIKAIIGVARAKLAKDDTIDRDGLFRRALQITERQ